MSQYGLFHNQVNKHKQHNASNFIEFTQDNFWKGGDDKLRMAEFKTAKTNVNEWE